jgi:hypothetical protein
MSDTPIPSPPTPASPGPQGQPPAQTPTRGWQTLGTVALAIALHLVLVDAAIETFRSGSPVRWWVVGTTAGYLAISVVIWQWRRAWARHFGWGGSATASFVVLLGLLAATAWLPGGVTAGVTAFGLPTSTLLEWVTAGGIGLAGLTLARAGSIPVVVRVAIAPVAGYGVIAFARAAAAGTSLPALLNGESVWQRLPFMLQGAMLGGLVLLPLALVGSIARAGLRRPNSGSLRGAIRECVALATSFAIVLAAAPLPAGSRRGMLASQLAGYVANPTGGASRDPTTLNGALENSLRAIEDGERESARDRWDPAYVVDRIGRDPERLFAWVRTNTFWVPYRGLLRGPVGVLMDRLGNGLDRAVLLATLLRQAGQSVRLAHGSLTDSQAIKLLPSLLVSRGVIATRPKALLARGIADQLPKIAAQYQLDEIAVRQTLNVRAAAQERIRMQLVARVPDETRRLSELLGKQHGRNDQKKRFDAAVDALSDHWWVERQDNDTWLDLDLLAGGRSGHALAAARETLALDSVTDALRHQVVMRVVAEQWANGALLEQTALERAVRPAELIGAPIALRFWPTAWPEQFPPADNDPKKALRTTALAQHEWVPVLQIGSEPVTQSSLRDNGDLGRVGQHPMSKVGGAGTDAFKGVTDLFGGNEPENAPPPSHGSILTAAWIEYVVRVPGEAPRTIRRAVFDLLGPAARAAKPVAEPSLDDDHVLARSLALMMETEIVPIVCEIAPEFVTHLTAQGLISNRDTLRALVRHDLPEDPVRIQKLAKRLSTMPSPLYALAQARFDWSRFARQIYIDQPNILTRHTFLVPAGDRITLGLATDIVAAEVGVDLLAPDPFAIRIEQGVLDTNAEALLRSGAPAGSNTGEAFVARGAWVMLASTDDPQLAALRLPDDARRGIEQELAGGYVVVAPRAPVPLASGAYVGWWHVDPASGHTLGMASNGWGQDLPEFALILKFEGILLAWLFAYWLCKAMQDMRSGGGPVSRACDPERRLDRPFADFLVAPLEAAGSDGCLKEAFLSALHAGLIGALGAGGSGEPGGPGSGNGSPEGVVDPHAQTQPGTPANPVAGAQGGPGGSAGTGGPGGTSPNPGGPSSQGASGVPGGTGGAGGPGGPELGPSQSDPVGRQLIRENPNSDATVLIRLQAGGDMSPARLEDVFNGADQAALDAYQNARAAGMSDQAANQFSQAAWDNYLSQNTPGLGTPTPGPAGGPPLAAVSPGSPDANPVPPQGPPGGPPPAGVSPISPGANSVPPPGPPGGPPPAGVSPISPGANSVPPPGPPGGPPPPGVPPISPRATTLGGIGGVANVLNPGGK